MASKNKTHVKSDFIDNELKFDKAMDDGLPVEDISEVRVKQMQEGLMAPIAAKVSDDSTYPVKQVM